MVIINSKEKLYYLIKEYLQGNYEVSIFCDLFSQVYEKEVDYNELNCNEHKLFRELSKMTARFSSDENDLRLPNVYFDEKAIRNKVIEILKTLNVQ